MERVGHDTYAYALREITSGLQFGVFEALCLGGAYVLRKLALRWWERATEPARIPPEVADG